METVVKNRKGEVGSPPFRSGRFYSVGTSWYFAVRDLPDQGPFLSKHAAENAFKQFSQERKF